MGEHAPARYTTYMDTHEDWMNRLRKEEFIQNGDTLSVSDEVPGYVRMNGQIPCRGDIVITVNKFLKVIRGGGGDGEPVVQTWRYAYNAHVRGHHTFMRCDNAHAHPGHPSPHHRHESRWDTGEDLLGSPFHVGEKWPNLGEFIRMVHDWYLEDRDELPDPEGVPEVGREHCHESPLSLDA